MTGSRPHRSYLELGAEPDAVPYARHYTRQTLAAWRLGDVANDVEVVVSELVTNAGAATLQTRPAAPVALYLALADDRLFVLVWDCCPKPPAPRFHAEDAQTGRGLEIVQALAGQWGTSLPDQGGKVVWARFDLDRRRP